MNQVFEDFVVTALREALGLSPSVFPQGGSGHRLALDVAGTISLQPDISWWESGRPVFAGDVKYKWLKSGAGPNSDLYQLLAYAVAADLPGGLLIYAKDDAETVSHVHEVVHIGKRLRVLALDLEQEPDCLLAQIEEIAGSVRELRRLASHRYYLTRG